MTYTVVSGDTLWGIAKQFGTTTDIILADNAIITDPNVIQVGWELTIRTPDEVAADKADQALSDQADGADIEGETLADNEPSIVADASPKVMWDDAEIVDGQIGRVHILRTTPLLEWSPGDVFRFIRDLQPEERYRVLKEVDGDWFATVDGASMEITKVYNLGGNQWVYSVPGYVEFESIPSDLASQIGKPAILSQQTIDAKTKTVDPVVPTTPYFESRNHPRPVIQIQRGGKIVTMELRVLGSSSSRSTVIQPNRTNGGFFINIAGSNLATFMIQGVFLDTTTNQEFDDFIDRYDQYVEAYRDGDYYSSPIVTLFYKGREYRGLIADFNYSDSTEQQLIRNFTLQLLVLKEKGRSTAKPPTVVSKDKVTGDDFYSDLRYLLINPITGLYGTDS